MSEANAPFNPPSQPASSKSAPKPKKKSTKLAKDAAWEDVWAEPSQTGIDSPKANALSADQIFDVSTLDNAACENVLSSPDASLDASDASLSESNEFNALSPDCKTVPEAMPANLSSIAAWSQEVLDPTGLPNLADLITLIQELNQCNGALMDRVSQLEEDLESSQSALQAELANHDQREVPCFVHGPSLSPCNPFLTRKIGQPCRSRLPLCSIS
ncbi:MAG: hypothetical protein HC827_14605 [Cyanobacteria bacterium RM1_2_2]|nr:hypothetical protein [Cyanobacteria bacterium RM1_2_2]